MDPMTITLTIRPALNGWIIEQRISDQPPASHLLTSAWAAIGQFARLMADWERMMAFQRRMPCDQPYAAGMPPPAATQKPEPPAAPPQPVAAPAGDASRSTSSAQAPAQPPRRPGRPPLASWTDARLALLPRYRTDDLTRLLADINDLPGERLSMKALMNKAHALRIGRDQAARRAAKAAAMRARMADEKDRARQATNARAVLAKARQAAKARAASASRQQDAGAAITLPPPGPDSHRDKVTAALRAGVKDWAAWAARMKIPLREAYRIKGEIERERKDAAA